MVLVLDARGAGTTLEKLDAGAAGHGMAETEAGIVDFPRRILVGVDEPGRRPACYRGDRRLGRARVAGAARTASGEALVVDLVQDVGIPR
jgi:hypothetical protein